MRRRVALLSIFLIISACSPKPNTGSVQLDPALETLVPADTIFVMAADVDAIRKTPVYQKHQAILNVPQLSEFVKNTGIDPRTDLWQLLSVANGKTAVLMARGKFSMGDLEPRLEKQGAKRAGYKGYTLFGGDKDDNAAVLLMNPTTALMGSTAELKSIIDNRDLPRHGLPPALAQRTRSIPQGSQLWVAFVGGVSALNISLPDNSTLAMVVRVLQGVESAALSIDLRSGFDLNIDTTCKNEAAAKQVLALLKAAIGFGRLSTPDSQPDLLKLYDAIKVEQVQSRVTVTAHVPPELVENFIGLWTRRHK